MNQKQEQLKMLLGRLLHSNVIPYALVGCCNTALDLSLYWLFQHWMDATIADALALAIAMTVAYTLHKNFVFRSHQPNLRALLREMAAFFGERAVTSAVNVGCVFVFVTLLGLPSMLTKLTINAVIVCVDYAASRLLVFRKKTPPEPDADRLHDGEDGNPQNHGK